MTIVSTADSSTSSALVAELGGSSHDAVDYMIGIGLIKDSEAVYFQYAGDDNKVALMQPNGKPVTRIGPVLVTGITVKDNAYADSGFQGDKVNVFLQTQSGLNLMITTGLTTMWAQCFVTALMGMFAADCLNSLVNVDTYKGSSKLGVYFANVRNNGNKMTSNALYEDFAAARADRDKALVEKLMRDSIAVVNTALSETHTVEDVVVNEVPADSDY